ncbi:hypothetical protein BCR34DRAFT_369539 [Clohesyomyces aquaticus]|uniref:Bacteriophage T5 Orf172 DNA-binding domain-containing protein n=1 Tax=Clohesyomyces aquaticus TaxID=1231657 RepID=A0A1Y1ZGX7_9PLEO|nr:hypothetical protein BCR34DRAFT_369539 [Clohesyomyces aquaticus]
MHLAMAASTPRQSPRSTSSSLFSLDISADSESSIRSARSLGSSSPSTNSSRSSDAVQSPRIPKRTSVRPKTIRKDSSSDCEILPHRPPIFEIKSEPRPVKYAHRTSLEPELDLSPSPTYTRHKRSTSDTRDNRPADGDTTREFDVPDVPDPVWLESKVVGSREIDVEIANWILKKVGKSKDTGIGQIYIFRASNPKWAGKVKIGMTVRCFSDRQKEICKKNLGLERVWSSSQVANVRRVEKLVHLDLECRLRYWTCGICKNSKTDADVKHQEWFEISEELAKNTVKRWVDLMNLEPYNEIGELKRFWRKPVMKMKEWVDDGRKPRPEITRWDRWATFVKNPPEPPTAIEQFVEKVRIVITHPIWTCLWKNRFQIVLLWAANFVLVERKYMVYVNLFHFLILVSSHWEYFTS